MRRIVRSLFALLVLTGAGAAADVHAADAAKVLRIALFDIDTLDPQQYTDDPSFQVMMAIFEPLYEWDYLPPAPKLTPLTAAAAREITDDGRTWTMRLKRGILFTDDPAFKGKPRELVADDYVYSYKRWLDPNGRRGGTPIAHGPHLGARPVVDAAREDGRFDFDAPIEGLRALDRYTLQLRLSEPNYPNVRDVLSFVGAVAREVVEAAGPDIRTRAVGTGPFRLRNGSAARESMLDANPRYREVYFPRERRADARGTRAQHEGQGVRRRSAGRDRIVDEDSHACCCSSRAASTS